MGLFDKGYFTFEDLTKRWGTGREEILSQVFSQELVPSYFLKPTQACEVMFREDGIEGDLIVDPDFPGQYVSGKFVFLRQPHRNSLTECMFHFASETAEDPMELVPFWNWYLFDTPISSTDGEIAFLKSQVEKFERKHMQSETASDKAVLQSTYPWGNHNTLLLTHLSEAAIKFWSLHDPSDATTAPTNEQVAQWLIGRGVVERTANVIATILRRDGLKMGRRK